MKFKTGDKVEFKGSGFLGENIYDCEIIEHTRNRYKCKMDIGFIIYLDDDDILKRKE